MSNNANTHDIFFRFLSFKKLNELLLRANETNGRRVLEDEINRRIQECGDTELIAKSKVSKTGDYPCSIYISFLNINNKEEGHVSFHFSPNLLKRPGKHSLNIGRTHPINNRNRQRKYTFKFNENQQSIRMSISNQSSPIRPLLKPYFETIHNVFNDYFDPTKDCFLGKPQFHNKEESECYEIIINKMKKSKTPISSTRKRTS